MVREAFTLTAIISRNIKRLREERGMSVEQLAVHIMISPEELEFIEAGGNTTLRVIFDICPALGCNLSEIIPGWEMEH